MHEFAFTLSIGGAGGERGREGEYVRGREDDRFVQKSVP
jgi:hypothetical protein